MPADQIVLAERAARSPPGGTSLREFAAREFSHEDSLWVTAVTQRRERSPGSSWISRLRRSRHRGKAPPRNLPTVSDRP